MTHFHLLRQAMLCAFLTLTIEGVQAAGLDYFSDGIDYWKKETLSFERKDSSATQKSKGLVTEDTSEKDQSQFDWKAQLDPKNDKFFREGDYTPPKAFMELARNPNAENIKNWFKLMETKNTLAARLEVRMQEYLHKNAEKIPDEGRAYIAEKTPGPSLSADKERFRFRMYFDSKCPHCKRMMATMEELQSKGFYVEIRQTDAADLKEAPSLPVIRATPGELNEKDVKSVPLLLVGDLQKKAVYRISGFQTVESIFQLIASSADKGSEVNQ